MRGDFITIVDIKQFLSIPKTNITEKTKIIVTATENIQVEYLLTMFSELKIFPMKNSAIIHRASMKKNKFTSAEIMFNDKVMCMFDLKKFSKMKDCL